MQKPEEYKVLSIGKQCCLKSMSNENGGIRKLLLKNTIQFLAYVNRKILFQPLGPGRIFPRLLQHCFVRKYSTLTKRSIAKRQKHTKLRRLVLNCIDKHKIIININPKISISNKISKIKSSTYYAIKVIKIANCVPIKAPKSVIFV